MTGFFRKLFLFVLSLLILSSCDTAWNSSYFSTDIYLDQQYFVPVGSAYATLSDAVDVSQSPLYELLVSDDTVFVLKSGHIKETLPTVDMLSSFPAYSKTFSPFAGYNVPGNSFSIPKDSVIPDQSVSFSTGFTLDPSLKKQQIDSIYFKPAKIAVEVNTGNIQGLDPNNLMITIDFIKNIHLRDGRKQIAYIPSAFGKQDRFYLGDFSVDCTDDTNSIGMMISVKFRDNRTRDILVNKNSTLSFSLGIENLNMDAVFGIFDFGDYGGSLTIDLPFDEAIPGSSLKLGDPELKLTATSNVGVNLLFSIDKLALNSTDGNKTEQRLANFNGSPRADFLLTKPSTLHEVKYTEFPLINNNYGRLSDAFASNMTLSGIDLSYAFRKPEVLELPEFLTTDAYYEMDYRFKAPLFFKNSSWIHFSTEINGLRQSFREILKKDTLQTVGIVLEIENEFPFDLEMNLDYLDADRNSMNAYLKKDMMFSTHYIVKAPPLDSTGHVIHDSISSQRIIYGINKQNFDSLMKVEHLKFDLVARSAKGKDMYFSIKDKINIKLGVFAKGDYITDINDLLIIPDTTTINSDTTVIDSIGGLLQ